MNLCGVVPIIHDIPAYRGLVTPVLSRQGSNKVAVLNAAKPYLVEPPFVPPLANCTIRHIVRC